MLSQAVAQQKGSIAHTQDSHAQPAHPGVLRGKHPNLGPGRHCPPSHRSWYVQVLLSLHESPSAFV